MKKIAIFGTYPPPIGGTSIHIKRLASVLSKHYKVNVYDTFGKKNDNIDKNVYVINNYKKFLIKYLITGKEDIIHSHTHSWKERIILTILAKIKRKKIIFTYHSLREEWGNLTQIDKFAVKFINHFSDYQIAVNTDTKNKLVSWGANESKLKLIPTFLLPDSEEIENLPLEIRKFKQKHNLIISANGSNNNKHKKIDLYGVDLCIELCARLNSEGHSIGFIFALTRITDNNYYNELLEKIKEFNIEANFLFVHKNMSFAPVLKHSDIFIRPTNTDTYGLSVGEAIALKVPTIASDVCERTTGTILFKNRKFEDLYKKTVDVINNYNKNKSLLYENKIKDYSEEIIIFYHELVND